MILHSQRKKNDSADINQKRHAGGGGASGLWMQL